MRLARLGSFHQCRLSFMRTPPAPIAKRENWTFRRPVWDIDANGVGIAVYSARGPERTYSLVCFAHDLKPTNSAPTGSSRTPGTPPSPCSTA